MNRQSLVLLQMLPSDVLFVLCLVVVLVAYVMLMTAVFRQIKKPQHELAKKLAGLTMELHYEDQLLEDLADLTKPHTKYILLADQIVMKITAYKAARALRSPDLRFRS